MQWIPWVLVPTAALSGNGPFSSRPSPYFSGPGHLPDSSSAGETFPWRLALCDFILSLCLERRQYSLRRCQQSCSLGSRKTQSRKREERIGEQRHKEDWRGAVTSPDGMRGPPWPQTSPRPPASQPLCPPRCDNCAEMSASGSRLPPTQFQHMEGTQKRGSFIITAQNLQLSVFLPSSHTFVQNITTSPILICPQIPDSVLEGSI